MSKARVAVVVLLFLVPWVFLVGVGGYHLFYAKSGVVVRLFGFEHDFSWMFWVAWLLLLSMGLSYYLAWRWTRGNEILPPTDAPAPNYWTDRDKAAWERVLAKAKSFDKV